MNGAINPRVISVRDGQIQPDGSWLYVWINLDIPAVSYVGATGLDPELRAHLHLTHENPAIGRVHAQLPHAATGRFDVLAFPLTEGASRSSAKQALISALQSKGLWSGAESPGAADPLVTPMAEAVEQHLGRVDGVILASSR